MLGVTRSVDVVGAWLTEQLAAFLLANACSHFSVRGEVLRRDRHVATKPQHPPLIICDEVNRKEALGIVEGQVLLSPSLFPTTISA